LLREIVQNKRKLLIYTFEINKTYCSILFTLIKAYDQNNYKRKSVRRLTHTDIDYLQSKSVRTNLRVDFCFKLSNYKWLLEFFLKTNKLSFVYFKSYKYFSNLDNIEKKWPTKTSLNLLVNMFVNNPWEFKIMLYRVILK
jgi:hypothetical protein